MTIRKETELMQAIIVYCQRCQDEGDFPALKEMGFGPREMKALTSLSAADKLRLASTNSHFLTVALDKKIYWRMIDYIGRENEKEVIVNELITHDAPLPLMYSLTGMGSKQYSLKRRQFGLSGSPPGRPSTPEENVAELVWSKLKEIIENSEKFGPNEFLHLYKKLDEEVPLRVIWYLFHRWEREGNLKVQRSDPVSQ